MGILDRISKSGKKVAVAEEKATGKAAGKASGKAEQVAAKEATAAAKAAKKLKKLGKGLVGARGKKASEAIKQLEELARAKIRKGSRKAKFYRSMSERRKALLRDANDRNSGLSQEARDYIKKHNGNKVPEGHEVSHEKPLYTAKTIEGKKELDKADNMKTMEKKAHRTRHKECGDQYHKYPR